ncbi:MAG TPA: VTT domain-containing protein [Chitinophagales bacterium]|nr:VTT domain-containing protein [Chitinophagales bacterium]
MLLALISLANTPEFREYISHWGSIGIFIWFITFNQLNPIPSEISLLVIGYLAAHHVFNPVFAGVASAAGFIAVDIFYYYLARSGSALIRKKIKRSESSFVKSYKKKLKTHMLKTLMVLNFIPRVRMFGPILAGGMKLSFKSFLLYNSISMVAFTAIYLSLGFVFHESLDKISLKMKSVQHIIFIAAMIIIAGVLFIIIRRKQKED